MRGLWPAACTTAITVVEYATGVATGLLPVEAWAGLPVVELSSEEAAFAARLSSKLGAGERSCLAVGQRMNTASAADHSPPAAYGSLRLGSESQTPTTTRQSVLAERYWQSSSVSPNVLS